MAARTRSATGSAGSSSARSSTRSFGKSPTGPSADDLSPDDLRQDDLSPDGLSVDGTPVDAATQSPPGDPEAVARIICLRMLDRRARSRAELAGALAKKGVPDDAATTVLDRFTEVGLLDDEALAQSIAGAQHRERGLARRALAVKLRQRGFDDEVVGDALATIDGDDERRRAAELVARRHRSLAGLPVEVRTRRLVGLLGRKGYPVGLAYEIVRAELSGTDEDGTAAFDD